MFSIACVRLRYYGLMTVSLFATAVEASAETPVRYQRPSATICDILAAPPPPAVLVSSTRDNIILIQSERYPPIADVAAPMLRLAGLRIDPRTNGPHLPPRVIGLTVVSVKDGAERPIPLPAGGHFGAPILAADGRRFAIANTTPSGIELWVGDLTAGSLRRIAGVRLSAVYGLSVQWMPDQATLVCQTVPVSRGDSPAAPAAPAGPVVQESYGKAAPARTYPDLLQNPHDEALFDYYATSQLVMIEAATGRTTPLGRPGIFADIESSPDGSLLLIERIARPYSYVHPVSAFPHDIEIWDRTGQVVTTIAKLPLQDQVPIEGVPTGPRSVHFRPTAPHTLVWIEALDEGNPKNKVPHRDRVMTVDAAEHDAPKELLRVEHRFAGLTWGEHNGLALIRDYDRDRRWSKTYAFSVNDPAAARLIWDRSIQDRYGDPGMPILRTLPNGRRVLWQNGESLFLIGAGASPEGDRPFLDRFNLATLKAERLFQSADKQYEAPLTPLTDDGREFLTRYESATVPPNIAVRTANQAPRRDLTHFTDPTPQIRGISKRLVTYKRADGVPLSFTLYLPPDHKSGTPLPTVVWAYPQEFNSADTAGQVAGSPYRFTTLAGPSHLFFLLAGYAVLDGATMPVVGDPETANDTFLQQIVDSARAAIDKGVELGVTDRNRVGVGGHSYGAFMTANLLAHSDLFKAGIARSGAYNRTLTPFGFQNERRTLWEAGDVYTRLSPFQFAHQIKAPLLLIHGAADNNPGTFPVQSERMFQAVRGTGGQVRYVVLPHESHGYVARESVEHTLYEMLAWFDKYVKGN
jgi:dipeptidyl aminopeptidase/acylaminoacyl peptidase